MTDCSAVCHCASVAVLPAEVKVKPYPFEPPISAYFQLIRVLAALDADRDNVISATEIDAAPAVLRKLDTNHDGSLSAEECGLHTDAMMDRLVTALRAILQSGQRVAA